jgi:hypothetical protein
LNYPRSKFAYDGQIRTKFAHQFEHKLIVSHSYPTIRGAQTVKYRNADVEQVEKYRVHIVRKDFKTDRYFDDLRHLDAHIGVEISETAKLLGTLLVPASTAGYLKLLTWANSLGRVLRAGVDGTGTYGSG